MSKRPDEMGIVQKTDRLYPRRLRLIYALRMETTDHTLMPDIATLEAVRRNHAQRLLDMAEALLQQFEAMELPKDAAGIDRAGKAMLTLHKTLDTLYTHAHNLAHQTVVKTAHDKMDGKPPADPAETLKVLKIYQAAQALRLEVMAAKRTGTKPDEGELETKSAPPRHHWP